MKWRQSQILRWPQYKDELKYEDNHKYEHNLKYECNLRYEDDLKYQDNLKYEDDLNYEHNPKTAKPNLPNQAYQAKAKHFKPTKSQHQNEYVNSIWQMQIVILFQNKQGSNQSKASLSLPWARYSSAPACSGYLFLKKECIHSK